MDVRQIDARVEELLASMTVEEKAAQMVQVPYAFVGREESLRWARLGAGSFLHVLGDDAREIQQAAIHESRLGIPVIFGIDAIHGHGLNDHGTIFPTQLAAAPGIRIWRIRWARLRRVRLPLTACTGRSLRCCASVATRAGAA